MVNWIIDICRTYGLTGKVVGREQIYKSMDPISKKAIDNLIDKNSALLKKFDISFNSPS